MMLTADPFDETALSQDENNMINKFSVEDDGKVLNSLLVSQLQKNVTPSAGNPTDPFTSLPR
jgi:hypothetical protein